jgi:hypothetical protein
MQAGLCAAKVDKVSAQTWPAGSPAGGTGAAPNFEAMSVRELKDWLRARGRNFEGAVEKADLVEIAKATPP